MANLGNPLFVAYLIFKDGKFVAKVPQSAQPKFVETNQPYQVAVYTVFALDAKGSRSKGISVSVPKGK